MLDNSDSNDKKLFIHFFFCLSAEHSKMSKREEKREGERRGKGRRKSRTGKEFQSTAISESRWCE